VRKQTRTWTAGCTTLRKIDREFGSVLVKVGGEQEERNLGTRLRHRVFTFLAAESPREGAHGGKRKTRQVCRSIGKKTITINSPDMTANENAELLD
jgi:hypothetical protein